jgi:hypothetical protein
VKHTSVDGHRAKGRMSLADRAVQWQCSSLFVNKTQALLVGVMRLAEHCGSWLISGVPGVL